MQNASRLPSRLAPLLPAFLALAACGDREPTRAETPPPPDAVVAAVACHASPARGTLTCGGAAPGGAGGGARFDQRILGGQGEYVRLSTSGASYAAGVFSFNATVQNLSDRPMATDDGAARHDEGVRVFFHVPPTPGSVAPLNHTGTGTFTAGGQDYFQYGGRVGGADQGELGGDGILSPGETSAALQWQLEAPPAVDFTFLLYFSTRTPPGALTTVAPQVTGVSGGALVPGATATLTGVNFSATPAGNTVTIGGAAATVTGGSATQLQVTVPCLAGDSAAVQVAANGMRGAPRALPLQGNRRTLALGQALVVTDAAQVACNEIRPTGAADAAYVVAVYNASASPAATAGFRISGDGGVLTPAPAPGAAGRGPLPRPGPPAVDPEAARARLADQRHHAVLEMNRREGARLRALFRDDPRMRPRRALAAAAPVPPPATRAFRVMNINTGSCNSYFTVNATRVYQGSRIAIYEDDATPAAFKAASSPAMQDYYNRIGGQYDADMEPVVRTHFGDPLRRDAATDNNGVLVALFTPLVNQNFPSVTGFITSCDQYPNAAGNLASNFGEYFYAQQPTVSGAGYTSNTPDNWYRTIRSTVVHEAKHVASYAARVANGAPFEDEWLEEGTARHAEELWARASVYGVAWKGNTGYGSAGAPGSLYCDPRPNTASCTASNPRRPSVNMSRHFSSLQPFLLAPAFYSPFGRTPSDDASYFYAVSWSLVRYAIDRYGASDAAFLGSLNESSATGTANLAARAGVSLEQLLGGWALALYADDYPGLAAPSADLQMPTWNFRDIYAGLHSDFPTVYGATYPVRPQPFGFGSSSPVTVSSVAGGGVSYFLFSGTHLQPQRLWLQSTSGGPPPSSLRIAIARLQ